MKTIVATLLCGAALFAAGPLRRAPGFCLIDANGQWQDLADYRGRIVLVEFMQTTCPHCAAFSTVLNGLKLKYSDKLAILVAPSALESVRVGPTLSNNHAHYTR